MFVALKFDRLASFLSPGLYIIADYHILISSGNGGKKAAFLTSSFFVPSASKKEGKESKYLISAQGKRMSNWADEDDEDFPTLKPNPKREVERIMKTGHPELLSHAIRPLFKLSPYGYKEAMEFLKDKASDKEVIEFKSRLAKNAAAEGNLPLLKIITDKGFTNYGNLLLTAADHGHLHIVNYLLQKGNKKNSATAIALAIATRNIKAVEYLGNVLADKGEIDIKLIRHILDKTRSISYVEQLLSRYEHASGNFSLRDRVVDDQDILNRIIVNSDFKAAEFLYRQGFDYNHGLTLLFDIIEQENSYSKVTEDYASWMGEEFDSYHSTVQDISYQFIPKLKQLLSMEEEIDDSLRHQIGTTFHIDANDVKISADKFRRISKIREFLKNL